MQRVRCYLDGLNFYYGICRVYDIKWIDLVSLFEKILKDLLNDSVDIEKLFLFTSTVRGDASDRQRIYFQALESHSPQITVIRGRFKEREKRGPLLEKDASGKDVEGPVVSIMAREEKRTDVNIACKIVDDAHMWDKNASNRKYDLTCLITNDSDISSALRIKKRLKQRILLISPRAEDSQSRVHLASALTEYIRPQDRVPCISKHQIQQNLLPRNVGGITPPKARGWSQV